VCDKPHLNPCGIPQLKVGRDVQGRFRPGNAGGPGNPFARKVAALRKTLLDSVSEQDLKDMVEALKLKARQGDTSAIKLLLQYCVGKPESPKDPDRMDADEWQRLRDMSVSEKEFSKTIDNVPACLACHRAETHWPCNVQDGPLAETVHYVRSQLRAGNPFAEVTYYSELTTQDDAQPDAAPAPPIAAVNQTVKPDAPTERTAATAQRPPSAKPTSKPDARREPAGQPRDNGRSPTRPPSPNGRIGDAQRQPPKQPQRPPQPSGQAQRRPPRR
jgi:hypothetical protein